MSKCQDPAPGAVTIDKQRAQPRVAEPAGAAAGVDRDPRVRAIGYRAAMRLPPRAALLCAGLALAACNDSYTPPPRPPVTTPPPQPRPQPQPQPQARPQPSDPNVALASHGEHTCARRRSGAISCWGKNSDGQLGDGTRVDQVRTAPIAGLSGAAEVVTGGNFSCARKQSGQVLCWGNNEDGQLGDGSGGKPGARSPTPVAVKGLSDAVELAAGDAHACARRRAGGVVCWGLGENGQIGVLTDRSATPVAVPGTGRAAQLAAGAAHTCARTDAGAVLCWGRNTEGQLGDDDRASRANPKPVVGLGDAAELVAGGNHACARRSSGGAVCWGNNDHGQLGDGKTGVFAQRTPVAVQGLQGALELAAGAEHTCARVQGGKALCWGSGRKGQLGEGGGASRPRPGPVAGLSGATDLALGAAHACALLDNGNVTCWGSAEHSALGQRRLGAR